MRMKALHSIDRGKDKIAPGEEFTPDSKKEGEMLANCVPPAAVWIEKTEKPEKDPGGGKDTKQNPPKKLSAEEAIAAINQCTSVNEVKEFFKGEDRATVKDAAKAKIKALLDQAKKDKK